MSPADIVNWIKSRDQTAHVIAGSLHQNTPELIDPLAGLAPDFQTSIINLATGKAVGDYTWTREHYATAPQTELDNHKIRSWDDYLQAAREELTLKKGK
ncbi:hypothetical protein HY086_02800 [Candidatus Gottesmanbacteria bacterium]|nr:hypothetical protein [Candidatus Gottesmanbacteria bacterium]